MSNNSVDDAFASLAWFVKRILGNADLYEGFSLTAEELKEQLGGIRGDLARSRSALQQLLELGFFTEEQFDELDDQLSAIFELTYPKGEPDADMFIPLFNEVKRLQAALDRYKFIP